MQSSGKLITSFRRTIAQILDPIFRKVNAFARFLTFAQITVLSPFGMTERKKSPPENKSTPRPKRHRARWAAILVLLIVVLLSGLAIANYANQTDWVPQLVDAVRNLPFVGPDRVAALEDLVYTAQDSWNQFYYDRTHGPIVVAATPDVRSSVITQAPTASAPDPENTPTKGKVSSPAVTPMATAPITVTASVANKLPSPFAPIILSDPQSGEGMWTARDMPVGFEQTPPILHTFYRPDPERPYARVDLVWMDLSQTELTLVQGTNEPRPIDGIRGTGVIPPTIREGGGLLAAWNGGFLTLHGAYGMMLNRRIIAPPRDGFAALAQYEDGKWKLGVWGTDITMTPDLVSFRQNGPILIDRGVLNQDPNLTWGKSVAGETRIWRSGIGLTADGDLIYGVGNSLSAQTLGEAIRRAGAVEAMELDVNAWHAFFFTYELTPTGLVATKLNSAIPGSLLTYQRPYDRDFMYLTLKP